MSATVTGTPASLRDQVVYDIASACKLLADPLRLRLLLLMAQEGEIKVGDLCDRVGQSQPAISHHLALLRVAALVEVERRGKNNFYRVKSDRLADLLALLLTATGQAPRKIEFGDFVLAIKG